MNRFYADEDFPHSILRGLRRLKPSIDVLTIQSDGLSGASDPQVLSRAADLGRVLLTRDKNTLVAHAYDQIGAGNPCPGIVVLLPGCSFGDAVEHLELIALVEQTQNLVNCVKYLPLR